jgi:hypothetical protein
MDVEGAERELILLCGVFFRTIFRCICILFLFLVEWFSADSNPIFLNIYLRKQYVQIFPKTLHLVVRGGLAYILSRLLVTGHPTDLNPTTNLYLC